MCLVIIIIFLLSSNKKQKKNRTRNVHYLKDFKNSTTCLVTYEKKRCKKIQSQTEIIGPYFCFAFVKLEDLKEWAKKYQISSISWINSTCGEALKIILKIDKKIFLRENFYNFLQICKLKKTKTTTSLNDCFITDQVFAWRQIILWLSVLW